MATRTMKDFKVTVHYPTEENKEEFDNRAARAVAKVLYESLSLDAVDALIDLYKDRKEV